MQRSRVFTVRLEQLKRDLQDPAFEALLEKGWTVGFVTETLEDKDQPGVPVKMITLFAPAPPVSVVPPGWPMLLGLSLGIGLTLVGLGGSALLLAGIAYGIVY